MRQRPRAREGRRGQRPTPAGPTLPGTLWPATRAGEGSRPPRPRRGLTGPFLRDSPSVAAAVEAAVEDEGEGAGGALLLRRQSPPPPLSPAPQQQQPLPQRRNSSLVATLLSQKPRESSKLLQLPLILLLEAGRGRGGRRRRRTKNTEPPSPRPTPRPPPPTPESDPEALCCRSLLRSDHLQREARSCILRASRRRRHRNDLSTHCAGPQNPVPSERAVRRVWPPSPRPSLPAGCGPPPGAFRPAGRAASAPTKAKQNTCPRPAAASSTSPPPPPRRPPPSRRRPRPPPAFPEPSSAAPGSRAWASTPSRGSLAGRPWQSTAGNW